MTEEKENAQAAGAEEMTEEKETAEEEITEEEITEEDITEEKEEPGEKAAAVEERPMEDRPAPSMHQAAVGRRISGELLFENKITITKEYYLEYIKVFLKKYRVLYYAIGAVSLLMGLYNLLLGSASSSLLFFAVTVFCLLLPFFMYRFQRNKKYQAQISRNAGKPLERHILFYSDAVEIFSNAGAHSVYGYDEIVKVIPSKSIYVIHVQNKLSLLVAKDGFVKGSLEDWKVFMMVMGKLKVRQAKA